MKKIILLLVLASALSACVTPEESQELKAPCSLNCKNRVPVNSLVAE